MLKKYYIFIVTVTILFFIDQYIKMAFVGGFRLPGECISLVLAYNKGVAFSMLSFLDGNLKYIQLVIISAGSIYLLINKEIFEQYTFALSLLYAGAISNVYDRFIHEGVVDYVYWHCGFDFAIFNLSDVFIDIAIVIILWISYQNDKLAKKNK